MRMNKLLTKSRIYPLLSFLIPFILYILTLSPGVNFGDTGELVTAAYTLGIPHPPGFPIWVLLAKIFTFLPFGNIAYRVNLASATFAAFSALALFFICKKILIHFVEALKENSDPTAHLSKKQQKKQKDLVESVVQMNSKRLEEVKQYIEIISLVTALTFAFLLPVWSFAVVTEVYTLNLLFTALILYCIILYLEQKNVKYLYFSAFLFGLAVTNHYLILFLGLAGFAWLIIHKRELLFNGRTMSISILCVLAGLLVFLYLPIRSSANPAIDWGNPETFENMMAVIGRKQFTGGEVTKAPLIPAEAQNTDIFLRSVQAIVSTFQSAWVSYSLLIVIVIVGLYAALRYIRNLYIPFIYSFLFCSTVLSFVINYAITPGDRTSTFIAAYLSLSVAMAIAFMYILYLASSYSESILNKSSQVVINVLLFLIPLVYIWLNYGVVDMSKNNIAHLHAQKILEQVPQNAIIFTEENNWLFPLLYMQAVEKVRPDVTIYDRNGNLFENIYKDINHKSEDDLERKRRAIEKSIIAQTNRPAYYAVDKSFENYGYTDLSAEGTLYTAATPQQINFDTFYKDILEIDDKQYANYYGSEYMIAYYHLQYAEKLRRDKKIDLALLHYDRAASWGRNEAIILNNLGVIYNQMGETERAKNVLLQALKVNNRNVRANKNLGVIFAQEGNYEEAEKYFTKALQINDRNIETIISLSMLYEQTGRKEKALQGYQFALTLDPQNVKLIEKVQQLSQ